MTKITHKLMLQAVYLFDVVALSRMTKTDKSRHKMTFVCIDIKSICFIRIHPTYGNLKKYYELLLT